MSFFHASQIDCCSDGFIKVSTFTANGSSDVVTTPITNVLATAGKSGLAVPLQVATDESTPGVVVNTTLPLWDATTREPFIDSNNEKVYGKLTHASGVYTLDYFTLVNGVETAYSFATDTDIAFLFPYRFDLYRRPANFATAYPIGDINLPNVGATTGSRWYSEPLTITALNTLSDLSKTPTNPLNVLLIINGKIEHPFGGGSAAFSVSSKTITWSATNAKYSIQTSGFDAVALYESNE